MNNNAIIGRKAGQMSCLLKSEKYNRKIDKIEELGSGMFETGRDL